MCFGEEDEIKGFIKGLRHTKSHEDFRRRAQFVHSYHGTTKGQARTSVHADNTDRILIL